MAKHHCRTQFRVGGCQVLVGSILYGKGTTTCALEGGDGGGDWVEVVAPYVLREDWREGWRDFARS